MLSTLLDNLLTYHIHRGWRVDFNELFISIFLTTTSSKIPCPQLLICCLIPPIGLDAPPAVHSTWSSNTIAPFGC